jgi:hypothetical protein
MVLSARRGFLHACIFQFLLHQQSFKQTIGQTLQRPEFVSTCSYTSYGVDSKRVKQRALESINITLIDLGLILTVNIYQ